ncbi:MAG: cofactor-independent phosphoglycerate mutase [Lachnospiraceae bacterium]|jgi:2,3-bisphosphoglycerate-independent phosphoglycerate mutase|nr:cofactor-independent phosphoglycerate mutase [Lachnospiraceae bacterium]
MKYIIILGDGMADEPRAELDGKTPLAHAHTPMLDSLSKKSRLGMAITVPPGMFPGSDTANLAVLGFDPARYYSGRSPLEAMNIGIPLAATDVAVRTNLVTISEEDRPLAERTIIDHSAGDITTADANILLDAVRGTIENDNFTLYTGTGYRHCLVWKNGVVLPATAPHDVLGQVIGPYLPTDAVFLALTEKSHQILSAHPLNAERQRQGKRPANCLWFWGSGTKPKLPSFAEKTGKRGMMVSAVDLLKGIAVATGMGVADVPGADGTLHTNYAGKVAAAMDALLKDGYDFAYIHIEAVDEASHQGDLPLKIKAIEYLDEKVVAPVYEQLTASGEDFRMLVLPDHPTPLRLRTHTADRVPFLLYDSTVTFYHDRAYNEEECRKSGGFIAEGHKLIDELLK